MHVIAYLNKGASMNNIDIITKVFPKVGTRLSVADAMAQLGNMYPLPDPNRTKKAAGSLGGSSNGVFIEFDEVKQEWVRVR